MTFKVVLSGFETKEQAQKWLNWYEGQGEQDDNIGEWIGGNVAAVNCDVHTGMIELPDGWEYQVEIHYGEEYAEDDEYDEDDE